MIYIIIEEFQGRVRTIGYFTNLKDLEEAKETLIAQKREFIVGQSQVNTLFNLDWRDKR